MVVSDAIRELLVQIGLPGGVRGTLLRLPNSGKGFELVVEFQHLGGVLELGAEGLGLEGILLKSPGKLLGILNILIVKRVVDEDAGEVVGFLGGGAQSIDQIVRLD